MPDSPWHGAVVFVDVALWTRADCDVTTPEPDWEPNRPMRIDVLDESGEVLDCIAGD